MKCNLSVSPGEVQTFFLKCMGNDMGYSNLIDLEAYRLFNQGPISENLFVALLLESFPLKKIKEFLDCQVNQGHIFRNMVNNLILTHEGREYFEIFKKLFNSFIE